MTNKQSVGKYFIVKDLLFSDFMKDEHGNIKLYDTEENACDTCGIYEFEDAIVCKVIYNHVEDEVMGYEELSKL